MFDFLYDSTALTGQINRVPNRYGMIAALGIFASEGIGSTNVEIREEEGSLKLLTHRERGSGAQQNDRQRGRTKVIKAAHFELEDLITPSDVQDRLAVIGRDKQPESVDYVLAKLLVEMASKHFITLEWLRMGALKGVVLDGDGTTELLNLYTEFGKTKKTVDFVLGTAGTDIIAKTEEVVDHIGTNLNGEVMDGVEGICSTTFFNKLIQHAKVEKFYQNWQAAVAISHPQRDTRGGNWGRVFEFHGITFREYKGRAPLSGGTTAKFVADDYCHFFPVGTMDTFADYFAPPDTLDTVNVQAALESDPDFGGVAQIFASPEILKHGKGVEIYTESNPVPLCKRPELLVEGSTSN